MKPHVKGVWWCDGVLLGWRVYYGRGMTMSGYKWVPRYRWLA